MKILVIIDLQKQFADKGNNNKSYNKCLKFTKEHKNEYDLCIATLFKQDAANPNYELHLKQSKCSDSEFNDLEFKDILKNSQCKFQVLTKNGYGLSADNLKQLYACLPSSLEQIDIIGCDSDASVMAVCFQLWDMGYTNIRILTDYIYTTADIEYGITRETWIDIMRRNFGNCVIIPKRRLSYDATFIANKNILYKGKTYLADIALYFEYKLIYGNGEEMYLESDTTEYTPPLKFCIDKENGYIVDYENSNLDNIAEYYPSSATIWENPNKPMDIPFEDAVQLLKDNFELYNNANNKPAQCISYVIREINENEK